MFVPVLVAVASGFTLFNMTRSTETIIPIDLTGIEFAYIDDEGYSHEFTFPTATKNIKFKFVNVPASISKLFSTYGHLELTNASSLVDADKSTVVLSNPTISTSGIAFNNGTPKKIYLDGNLSSITNDTLLTLSTVNEISNLTVNLSSTRGPTLLTIDLSGIEFTYNDEQQYSHQFAFVSTKKIRFRFTNVPESISTLTSSFGRLELTNDSGLVDADKATVVISNPTISTSGIAFAAGPPNKISLDTDFSTIDDDTTLFFNPSTYISTLTLTLSTKREPIHVNIDLRGITFPGVYIETLNFASTKNVIFTFINVPASIDTVTTGGLAFKNADLVEQDKNSLTIRNPTLSDATVSWFGNDHIIAVVGNLTRIINGTTVQLKPAIAINSMRITLESS